MIDQGFNIKIEQLENGYINTPHGIFTPNEHLGLNAVEVYEQYLYNLENPPEPQLTIDEKVDNNTNDIAKLVKELELTKQENADLYYELMTSGVI